MHLNAKLAILAVAVAVGLAIGPASAQQPTAAGLWQRVDEKTQNPLIWFLLVDRGGDIFEGYAAKLFPQPGDQPNPACVKCTDDRKGMPLLGLPMIRGMKRKGLRYEDGTVLDPRDGKVYSAVMTLDPAKRELTLRGYFMFEWAGKNDKWFRVPDSGFKEVDPAILAKYAPERLPGAKGKSKRSQR